MKRTSKLTGVGAVIVAATAFAFAGVQDPPKEAVVITPDRAEFEPVIPGVSKANLWGDPEKGPYGALTRFDPGFKAPMHIHSHDLRIVVLSGAYIFKTDKGETRVGPKEYCMIPAGLKHVSGGDPKEGALFYEESQGKFDLVEVGSGK